MDLHEARFFEHAALYDRLDVMGKLLDSLLTTVLSQGFIVTFTAFTIAELFRHRDVLMVICL